MTAPRAKISTLFSPKSNKYADRSAAIISRVLELDSGIVTVSLNSLLLQNNGNLHRPVSVEVSVREIRPIQQQPRLVDRPACGQTSVYGPDFGFRFLLCSPVFTFFRVSFSRTRSTVTFL